MKIENTEVCGWEAAVRGMRMAAMAIKAQQSVAIRNEDKEYGN